MGVCGEQVRVRAHGIENSEFFVTFGGIGQVGLSVKAFAGGRWVTIGGSFAVNPHTSAYAGESRCTSRLYVDFLWTTAFFNRTRCKQIV